MNQKKLRNNSKYNQKTLKNCFRIIKIRLLRKLTRRWGHQITVILVKTKSKKEKHKLRRMAYKLNKKMQKVKEKKGLKKKNLF